MTSTADLAIYSSLRRNMVESQLRPRGITDERVLDAMMRVPRHEFAPSRYRDQAYEDHPLPIAEGQSISQPYIVAIMLQALALSPGDRVLEIGTGSGYVTALLAELTSQVVSIERHRSLADAARFLLADMGYRNLRIIVGDGTQGAPDSSPYDAIIVSAAAPELPQRLIEQLAESGRMIIPVGREDAQQLQFIEMKNGRPLVTPTALCRFVPLISENS